MEIRTRMCISADGCVTTPDGWPVQLADPSFVAGERLERTGAGALVFRDARGERLHNSPKLPPGSPRGLPFSERSLWAGSGELTDLDACVYAVAQACS
jgi:hypothetical protein